LLRHKIKRIEISKFFRHGSEMDVWFWTAAIYCCFGHPFPLDKSQSADTFEAMNNNLLFRCSTMLATILLAFGLVTSVHAQSTASITLLDDAYATLAQGNHDYKGHRVRAMKQIDAALGEIGAKVSGKGRNHEPQGTSDAQMRAAESLLQEARPGLSGKALKHVENAIAQINDGLAIK
jgi:hypothetical protein